MIAIARAIVINPKVLIADGQVADTHGKTWNLRLTKGPSIDGDPHSQIVNIYVTVSSRLKMAV